MIRQALKDFLSFTALAAFGFIAMNYADVAAHALRACCF